MHPMDTAAPIDDQEATNQVSAPAMDDDADNDVQDVPTEAHTPMEAAPAAHDLHYGLVWFFVI